VRTVTTVLHGQILRGQTVPHASHQPPNLSGVSGLGPEPQHILDTRILEGTMGKIGETPWRVPTPG